MSLITQESSYVQEENRNHIWDQAKEEVIEFVIKYSIDSKEIKDEILLFYYETLCKKANIAAW